MARRALAALRDLVPVLGLAIKSAAQADIAKTLGRVYLGRDAAEQVLRGQIARGVTERINAVLWFSDLRGSTAISESIEPGEIIPFLNDYAQASIDAIHDAGGEVLKLIGDGVLAMFTHENMAAAKRAALRAEHRFRRNMKALTARRAAESRPVTTAHVGLHVGEVFYGNIGSDDRLDFTVVGPAVNEVSRIASMCRSVDRELLMSSAFRSGLDAAGRNYLVSTGRYALRGIGRAQGSLLRSIRILPRTRSWPGSTSGIWRREARQERQIFAILPKIKELTGILVQNMKKKRRENQKTLEGRTNNKYSKPCALLPAACKARPQPARTAVSTTPSANSASCEIVAASQTPIAAVIICQKPTRADAAPALSPNGDSACAVPSGLTMPMPSRNTLERARDRAGRWAVQRDQQHRDAAGDGGQQPAPDRAVEPVARRQSGREHAGGEHDQHGAGEEQAQAGSA